MGTGRERQDIGKADVLPLQEWEKAFRGVEGMRDSLGETRLSPSLEE